MLYSRKEAIIEHVREVNLPGEMTYAGMRVGERVLVEKIANTVMSIEKL